MDMVKVCAIVGATRKNSNTVYLVSYFMEVLKKEIEGNIEFELYNLYDYEIQNCIGCYKCLNIKNCIIKDGMEILKQAMLESNIIIWASPVYMNGISGVMKTFIDRLHSWTKLLCLRGKYGIILSSSSHKIYDIYIKDYLIWIQSVLGVINIGAYNICVDYPQELYSENSKKIIGQYVCETIINYRANYCRMTPMHEKIFSNLKKSILLLKEKYPSNRIVQYWEENGLINCEKFQDYFNKNEII